MGANEGLHLGTDARLFHRDQQMPAALEADAAGHREW
jgi:hypothetical protein